VVPHEVHDVEMFLSDRDAKATSELLQEHDGRLSRTQHQDRVEGRDIDALVEEIDGEQDLEFAPFKLVYDPGPQARLRSTM
jgi:hypothetical protein